MTTRQSRQFDDVSQLPPPPQIPPPSQRPPRRPEPAPPGLNPWVVRLPLLVVSGALLLLLGLGALATAYTARYAERIAPGVNVYGLDVGGLTRADAAAVLTQQIRYAADSVFTFRDGERFWQMNAAELGVRFDVEATLDEAYAAGHGGGLLFDMSQQLTIYLTGRSVAPVFTYDQNAAAARLRAIAGEVNIPAQDAQLIINGSSVSTTAGQVGRTLDVNATLRRLDSAVLGMQSGGELLLVINETPPLVWDATTAAALVQTALAAPLTLTANAQDGTPLGPWVVGVDQIAALLDVRLVDNGDGTRSYRVSIDMAAFSAALEALAPGLAADPVDGRFRFNVNTRELDIIQPGVNGRTLNVPLTLAALESAVFSPTSRTVAMVFDYTLPDYHDGIRAADLGIVELVGEATTYYAGSTQNRRSNIARGASYYDGIIVAPGEEFSFNRYLGDISVENGFVQGKIIFGGRTIDGVGGGICQVSTTLFRAAYNAGFPFTERHSHGYRVGFYEQQGFPPGLDAAIYQPTLDLRFINDTQRHILIEVSVYPANDSIQFRIYGTNPGRTVETENLRVFNVQPPLGTIYEINSALRAGQTLQVDWAAEGAEVSLDRVLRDPQGNELRRDTFYTRYLPWAAVVQVPPGDSRAGQSGG